MNPDCLSVVLMGYIRKVCGFENLLDNLDLASESGEVMDLLSKGRDYATKILDDKASYILVKVIGDDLEDTSPSYVSLLDTTSDKLRFLGIPLYNFSFQSNSSSKRTSKGRFN